MVVFNNILAGAAGQTGGAAAGYTIDRSIRFNSADSAYLDKTPSAEGNRKTFTFSAWVKKSTIGGSARNALFNAGTSLSGNSGFFGVRFQTADTLNVTTGSTNLITTARVFRDSSAWYHIVVTGDTTLSSNQFKIYVNGVLDTQGGSLTVNTDLAVGNNVVHEIGRTTWSTNEHLNGYLADVHFIDGQALAPTDFGEYDNNNVWQPKAYSGTYGTNGFHLDFSDNSSNAALGYDAAGSNDWTVNNFLVSVSNPSYDPTHGSDITSTEAAKIFDSDDSTYGVATGNFVGFAYGGSSVKMKVENTSSGQVSFYIQPNVSNSATNSGTWGSQSAGTISGNQWYIPGNTTATATFTFPATWDGDGRIYTSGNASSLRFYSMDGSAADFAGIDSLIDTPTNYEASSGNNGGNYATLNPLLLPSNSSLSNGNLEFDSGTGGYTNARSTIGVSSGKWYAEFDITVSFCYIGIALEPLPNTSYGGDSVYGWIYHPNGSIYHNNVATSYGESFGADLIGVAFDADNRTVIFYKNGVSQGSYSLGSNAQAGDTFFFLGTGYISDTYSVNFGQRPFAYTAPSGYKALCTTNLPDPTIADGSTAMDVALYTGTSSSQSVTTGFGPDLVWIKDRVSGVYNHQLYDTIRGVNSALISNTTAAEANFNAFTSFDADGFTVPNANGTNTTNNGMVAWAWDAGTSNTSISVGGLNSSAYDQSQTWSSTGTSTNTTSIADAFDGDLTSFWSATNGTVSRYTFASVYSGTKFELYMTVSLAATNFSVNGQSSSSVTGPFVPQWVDVTDAVTASGLGGLSYIDISFSAAQYATYIYAIKIDGKILVDSNVTPPNVPTIASTVRANPSAGFSIVTWTTSGTTGDYISVAHGLNALPGLVITKSRSNADSWYTAHGFDLTQFGMLNSTNAFSAAGVAWGDGITSSVIGMRVGNFTANNYTHVAYCWAPVEGYSAFGSYTGNGSADGPFVYTGFRPRWVMVKASSGVGSWYLYDSARNTANVVNLGLYPNLSAAELTLNVFDFLSNGFKLRNFDATYGANYNGNGVTYLYAAFAENPFKTARAR